MKFSHNVDSNTFSFLSRFRKVCLKNDLHIYISASQRDKKMVVTAPNSTNIDETHCTSYADCCQSLISTSNIKEFAVPFPQSQPVLSPLCTSTKLLLDRAQLEKGMCVNGQFRPAIPPWKDAANIGKSWAPHRRSTNEHMSN